MYAYQGPGSPPVTRDDGPRRDAAWDEEYDDEADDEFDPMGLTTNTASRRKRSRFTGPRRRKVRAQSVESTHSASTTGHFITSSQAASPGDTTGFVELSEEMERRVARVLDPAASPKPVHLSPSSTSRAAPFPRDSDASLLYPEMVPVEEEPKKRWRLPSFQSLLQSVGEFATLQPSAAQQPQTAPTHYYEDTRTTSGPRQPYSAHNPAKRHSFAGSETSFDSGYVSANTTAISSQESMRRSTQVSVVYRS